jgi:hypothetical protein
MLENATLFVPSLSLSILDSKNEVGLQVLSSPIAAEGDGNSKPLQGLPRPTQHSGRLTPAR